VLFNGPRAGINFNGEVSLTVLPARTHARYTDGYGGGNLVEYNLGFNMVRETSDHGVLNSWDRMPFVTNVSGGVSIWPARSTCQANFFVSNYESDWPVCAWVCVCCQM
jgi:hypothetical protein